MSARNLLARSGVLLLLIGQSLSIAHAERETEPVERAPVAANSGPDVVGSLASGADLVGMVERQLGGARAYDLALNDQGGAVSFEIKSIQDGKIWSTVVDAASRRIVSSIVVMPTAELQGDDKRSLEAFERSRMTLVEAIAIAEKFGAGRAVSAGLHYSEGKLVIAVAVVSAGSLKEIHVEPDKRPARGRSQDGRPRSPR